MSHKKKTILTVIGLLLLIGTIGGGNLKLITNWSSAEMVGYNFWSIFSIIIGGYLTYLGFKNEK